MAGARRQLVTVLVVILLVADHVVVAANTIAAHKQLTARLAHGLRSSNGHSERNVDASNEPRASVADDIVAIEERETATSLTTATTAAQTEVVGVISAIIIATSVATVVASGVGLGVAAAKANAAEAAARSLEGIRAIYNSRREQLCTTVATIRRESGKLTEAIRDVLQSAISVDTSGRVEALVRNLAGSLSLSQGSGADFLSNWCTSSSHMDFNASQLRTEANKLKKKLKWEIAGFLVTLVAAAATAGIGAGGVSMSGSVDFSSIVQPTSSAMETVFNKFVVPIATGSNSHGDFFANAHMAVGQTVASMIPKAGEVAALSIGHFVGAAIPVISLVVNVIRMAFSIGDLVKSQARYSGTVARSWSEMNTRLETMQTDYCTFLEGERFQNELMLKALDGISANPADKKYAEYTKAHAHFRHDANNGNAAMLAKRHMERPLNGGIGTFELVQVDEKGSGYFGGRKRPMMDPKVVRQALERHHGKDYDTPEGKLRRLRMRITDKQEEQRAAARAMLPDLAKIFGEEVKSMEREFSLLLNKLPADQQTKWKPIIVKNVDVKKYMVDSKILSRVDELKGRIKEHLQKVTRFMCEMNHSFQKIHRNMFLIDERYMCSFRDDRLARDLYPRESGGSSVVTNPFLESWGTAKSTVGPTRVAVCPNEMNKRTRILQKFYKEGACLIDQVGWQYNKGNCGLCMTIVTLVARHPSLINVLDHGLDSPYALSTANMNDESKSFICGKISSNVDTTYERCRRIAKILAFREYEPMMDAIRKGCVRNGNDKRMRPSFPDPTYYCSAQELSPATSNITHCGAYQVCAALDVNADGRTRFCNPPSGRQIRLQRKV